MKYLRYISNGFITKYKNKINIERDRYKIKDNNIAKEIKKNLLANILN